MENQTTVQQRMKALVVGRLMLGDFDSWEQYQEQLNIVHTIQNRRTARALLSQIGKKYKTTRDATARFIEDYFVGISEAEFAKLSEHIVLGSGLSLRLSDFESAHFELAQSLKRRFPPHCHLLISIWGLQFEYPEMHFLNDIEAGIKQLDKISLELLPFGLGHKNPKHQRPEVAHLISLQKLLSRSLVSASFSLLEAQLSGMFFAATKDGKMGSLIVSDDFRKFAETKESAPLKARLERALAETISCDEGLHNFDPFKAFLETGKRYRDAIHHTSPFERKDIEAGGRLTALYELNSEIALTCAEQALYIVSFLDRWMWQDTIETDVMVRCKALLDIIQPPSEATGLHWGKAKPSQPCTSE